MTQLGEALLLLWSARNRVGSIRAAGTTRYDPELSRQAYERFARSPAGREAGYDELMDEMRDDHDIAPTEEHWRLWVEYPERMREERDTPDGTRIEIADGARWWIYDPKYGPHSNEDDPEVGSSVGD